MCVWVCVCNHSITTCLELFASELELMFNISFVLSFKKILSSSQDISHSELNK